MFDESGNDAKSTRCSDTGKSAEEVSSDSAIVRPNLRNRMSRPAQVLNFWAHYKFIVLLTPVRVAIVGEKSPFHSWTDPRPVCVTQFLSSNLHTEGTLSSALDPFIGLRCFWLRL